ncbi:hypothetical protein BC827DRAFT_187441 [Russula dissimulans]|nr:hypothetical protein BC827DRAFT_187441 [Russula dissimulans]
MTCIAWNPAADPFMFATGSHDGTVQIWTTPRMPLGNSSSRPAPTTPLTEASAPRSAQPRAMHAIGPVLREHGHRYIPALEHDSVDITEKYDLSGEALEVSSLNDVVSRRHSWV